MSIRGRIIFRTDGGLNGGLNHFVRCAALAEILSAQYECVLAIRNPNPAALQFVGGVFQSIIFLPDTENFEAEELIPHLQSGDIVVLDGIHFQTEYQKKIREQCRLICIDDLHQHHFVADAIINPAEGILPQDYSTEEHTRFYLGARYAMIRKPFIDAELEERNFSSDNCAMIHIGGYDSHNITQKVLTALVETKMISEAEVVVSKMNPNISSLENFILAQKKIKIMLCINLPVDELCDLMKNCRYMICTANNFLFEACAVRMKILSGIISDSQQRLLLGMSARGATNNCGNFFTATEEELRVRFALLMSDETNTFSQLRAQRELIDGKSGERLKDIFNQY